MNIAPQLGVIQTSCLLTQSLIYGIDIRRYLELIYEGKRWELWLHASDRNNKFLCGLLAGHYHTLFYKELSSELNKYVDIKSLIISEIYKVIDFYIRCLNNENSL